MPTYNLTTTTKHSICYGMMTSVVFSVTELPVKKSECHPIPPCGVTGPEHAGLHICGKMHHVKICLLRYQLPELVVGYTKTMEATNTSGNVLRSNIKYRTQSIFS